MVFCASVALYYYITLRLVMCEQIVDFKNLRPRFPRESDKNDVVFGLTLSVTLGISFYIKALTTLSFRKRKKKKGERNSMACIKKKDVFANI